MSLNLFGGMRLTPSRLNRLVPVTVAKPGDTSRSNTIARTADPDLVLALLPFYTYDVDGMLFVTSAANAAGDFSYELQYPANATCTPGGLGLHNALPSGSSADLEANALAPDATSPAGPLPYGASTALSGILVKARIAMGVTAGNLLVAWAQLASNANATTLKAGSWLTARPVDGPV